VYTVNEFYFMHYNISLLNLLIIFFLRVKQVEKKNINSKIKPDFQQTDSTIGGKCTIGLSAKVKVGKEKEIHNNVF
jgi:hypothetical protein